jgi:uncharacterized protein (TIGR02118 family)
MLKFMVVLYRRQDLSAEEFAANLRQIHGPMAERIPGLRRYVQNHVAADPSRVHPGWDAIVELYWDDRASMENAWRSPEGEAANPTPGGIRRPFQEQLGHRGRRGPPIVGSRARSPCRGCQRDGKKQRQLTLRKLVRREPAYEQLLNDYPDAHLVCEIER